MLMHIHVCVHVCEGQKATLHIFLPPFKNLNYIYLLVGRSGHVEVKGQLEGFGFLQAPCAFLGIDHRSPRFTGRVISS